MNSEYKKIAGSNNYYITNDGHVFKKYGDYNFKFVAPVTNPETGYHMVSIMLKNGKQWNRTIHRLVAEAFLSKPKVKRNLEVAHLDNNKSNNHYSNLRWMSHSDNMKSGWQQGLFKKVSKSVTKKRKSLNGKLTELTEEDVKQIRRLKKGGFTNRHLAFVYNLHAMQISRICNYRSFANVI